MRIQMTGHSVCGFDTNNDARKMIEALRGKFLHLRGARRVHETYYASHGYILLLGTQQIGWVPKANFQYVTEQLRERGFEANVELDIPVFIDGTYRQDTGKIGLIVSIIPPIPTQKTQPQPTGATPVSKLPTLQQIIDANMAGLSTAAQLETGHVANLQLVKIVGKRLPKQYEAMLKTPFGHLLLANAVNIAGQSLYPQNALLKKVSNAMVVDSYQQLIKLVDIPGIIDELLNNKEVLTAHAKDEADKE